MGLRLRVPSGTFLMSPGTNLLTPNGNEGFFSGQENYSAIFARDAQSVVLHNTEVNLSNTCRTCRTCLFLAGKMTKSKRQFENLERTLWRLHSNKIWWYYVGIVGLKRSTTKIRKEWKRSLLQHDPHQSIAVFGFVLWKWEYEHTCSGATHTWKARRRQLFILIHKRIHHKCNCLPPLTFY